MVYKVCNIMYIYIILYYIILHYIILYHIILYYILLYYIILYYILYYIILYYIIYYIILYYIILYYIITLCYNKMLRGSPVSSVVPCSNGHPMVIRIVKRQAPATIQVDFADPELLEVRPLGLLWVMFWAPQHPNIPVCYHHFPHRNVSGCHFWGISGVSTIFFWRPVPAFSIADADGFMGIIAGVLHFDDRIWREGAPRNCKP